MTRISILYCNISGKRGMTDGGGGMLQPLQFFQQILKKKKKLINFSSCSAYQLFTHPTPSSLFKNVPRFLKIMIYARASENIAQTYLNKGNFVHYFLKINNLAHEHFENQVYKQVNLRIRFTPCFLLPFSFSLSLSLSLFYYYFFFGRRPPLASRGKGGGSFDPPNPPPPQLQAWKREWIFFSNSLCTHFYLFTTFACIT